MYAHLGAKRLCRVLADATQFGLDRTCDIVGEGAKAALHFYRVRDDIEGITALDRGNRHDGLFERIHHARDDGLHGSYDMAGNNDGIACLVRLSGMSADSLNGNVHAIRRRHGRTAHDAKMADRHARPVVDSVGAFDRKPRQ